MIDKLRSHLQTKKAKKGFTLIELLVVIAIIAILVVIVLVAINPLQRIADANKQANSSSVNQMGKAVATCVTDLLGQSIALGTATDSAHCGTAQAAASAITYLKTNNYTNLTNMPANTSIAARPAACAVTTCTDVCVDGTFTNAAGATRHNTFTYTAGTVSQDQAASC